MIMRWKPIFERAKWLLQGLFPDVRVGRVDGTCLLFNMERLFESVLGLRMRSLWSNPAVGNYGVVLQGPRQHLAESDKGFHFDMRPDITIWDGDRIAAIFDAKWKRLDPALPNAGVSPADAYQMTTYASRYGCRQIALVFPASTECPPGMVELFTLLVPNSPHLIVVAVDLHSLTNGFVPEALRPPSKSASKYPAMVTL